MVLAAQINKTAAHFPADVVFPLLTKVHEECAAAKDAAGVRAVMAREIEVLKARLKDAPPPGALTSRQLAAVANHPCMHEGRMGFHRIVYQFNSALEAYRPGAPASATKRPEQLRLPSAGLSPREALMFWTRVTLTFLDSSAQMLLIAPDASLTGPAGWVDLIVGDATPANIFCIKAGLKTLPLTSDIPYTLDPNWVGAINTHIDHCASISDSMPVPDWPEFSRV
jgi:hypothetical protein